MITIIRKLIALPIVLVLAIARPALADSQNANIQTSASVSAVCTIQAQNISFGNLVLPVSAQSAGSSMTVLCSKNATYTVNLAYGGVYGSGSGNSTIPNGTPDIHQQPNGDGTVTCFFSSNPNWNWNSAPSAGEGSVTYQASSLVNGQCPNNYYSTGYSYGKLVGVMNGDSLGYSIAVPNNPSEVWNAGVNAYSSTGTGISQSLPMVATLIPSQSSSTYPAPDSYMDTVTATISF